MLINWKDCFQSDYYKNLRRTYFATEFEIGEIPTLQANCFILESVRFTVEIKQRYELFVACQSVRYDALAIYPNESAALRARSAATGVGQRVSQFSVAEFEEQVELFRVFQSNDLQHITIIIVYNFFNSLAKEIKTNIINLKVTETEGKIFIIACPYSLLVLYLFLFKTVIKKAI